MGSLRKGITDSMVNNRHADDPKGVILSKSTCIYYNHFKQQENILEVGATTKMLVEVVKRRTLDKFLKEDNLAYHDSSTKQNDPFYLFFRFISALG